MDTRSWKKLHFVSWRARPAKRLEVTPAPTERVNQKQSQILEGGAELRATLKTERGQGVVPASPPESPASPAWCLRELGTFYRGTGGCPQAQPSRSLNAASFPDVLSLQSRITYPPAPIHDMRWSNRHMFISTPTRNGLLSCGRNNSIHSVPPQGCVNSPVLS